MAARGGRAEYRVARRRGQAVAPAERRRTQTCRELGSGGRGRQQVEVERHGCAVCWAGRGGLAAAHRGEWSKRQVQGTGKNGWQQFFLFLMLFPKKI